MHVGVDGARGTRRNGYDNKELAQQYQRELAKQQKDPDC